MRYVISGIRFKTETNSRGVRHQNVGSGVIPVAILADNLSCKTKLGITGIRDGVRLEVGFFHLPKICTKRGAVQEFSTAHKHFSS